MIGFTTLATLVCIVIGVILANKPDASNRRVALGVAVAMLAMVLAIATVAQRGQVPQ
jgi:drug/metabolite transporter (DMT)-like permease